jgi:hypothetical protein
MRVLALERPAGRRRIAHLLPLRGSLARRVRAFVVLITGSDKAAGQAGVLEFGTNRASKTKDDTINKLTK